MDRSSLLLFDTIRTDRALLDMPAVRERVHLERLAAEIARCCRATFGDRLHVALGRRPSAVQGAVR